MGTGDRGPGTGKRRKPGTGNREPGIGKTTTSPADNVSPVTDHRSPVTGSLYIVATPIGNLEDITFRAVRILREVDLIAAEDTRHSRKLLSHFGIAKPLTSYFDHNKNIKGEYLLTQLREGRNVALVSDAGTPCISDPGYQLVRDAIAEGITIIPVPGPCAAVAALSSGGVPTDSFLFEGFLPSRRAKRRDKLASLAAERRVIVLYETANRLPACLEDVSEVLGDRYVVVARELTKLYEQFVRGQVFDVLEQLQGQTVKGEVVLLISPSVERTNEPLPVDELLCRFLQEMSLKDAVKRVVLETGLPRSVVYHEALRLQRK